jgi:hypothetical protein
MEKRPASRALEISRQDNDPCPLANTGMCHKFLMEFFTILDARQ